MREQTMPDFSEGDFVRVKLRQGCDGAPGRLHIQEEDGRYGEVRSARLIGEPEHDHPIAVLYCSRTGGRTYGGRTGLARHYRAAGLVHAVPAPA